MAARAGAAAGLVWVSHARGQATRLRGCTRTGRERAVIDEPLGGRETQGCIGTVYRCADALASQLGSTSTKLMPATSESPEPEAPPGSIAPDQIDMLSDAARPGVDEHSEHVRLARWRVGLEEKGLAVPRTTLGERTLDRRCSYLTQPRWH